MRFSASHTSFVVLAGVAAITLILCSTTIGQNLDGSPYTPGVDADIDLYLVNAFDSAPVITHGTLEERAILIPGDPLDPPAKGAVLLYASRFSHATLPAGSSTAGTALDGQQEVFFVLSGTGTIRAGRTTADLSYGICVLVPEGLRFTITAGGDEPLAMYLISEPVPEDFTPVKELVVKNANRIPINEVNYHWTHKARGVLSPADGLATLSTVLTVTQPAMTIGHPHSHNTDFEETWAAIDGDTIAFLGKKIRHQTRGTAYMIPPDDKTPHCNINTSDQDALLLYFSTRFDLTR